MLVHDCCHETYTPTCLYKQKTKGLDVVRKQVAKEFAGFHTVVFKLGHWFQATGKMQSRFFQERIFLLNGKPPRIKWQLQTTLGIVYKLPQTLL